MDPETEELRKSGVRLHLPSQPFQVLMLLLRRAGDVVSREELQQWLWPEGPPADSDHSLSTAVNRLRTTLCDTAGEAHFDFSPELEAALEEKGKMNRLAEVKAISDLINICFVRQKRALGLGHAVNCARDVVGNEAFAVVLPDDIIMSRVPVLKQMKEVHEALGASVLALMEVPKERISAYGVVDAEPHPSAGTEGRLYKLRGMVEKPKPEDAPSNLAIIGRYILMPEIFGYLDKTSTGAGGELQLTDGLRNMLADMPIYGYVFEGTRYDAGDKFGYLEATIDYALAHPEMGERFREFLKNRRF